jgi:hypothetical protein
MQYAEHTLRSIAQRNGIGISRIQSVMVMRGSGIHISSATAVFVPAEVAWLCGDLVEQGVAHGVCFGVGLRVR